MVLITLYLSFKCVFIDTGLLNNTENDVLVQRSEKVNLTPS